MTEVKGYTPLSDDAKELANEGKVLEERMMRWIDKVQKRHALMPKVEGEDPPAALAQLGKRAIQEGTMWVVRSIFQPQRIALPEDNPERST